MEIVHKHVDNLIQLMDFPTFKSTLEEDLKKFNLVRESIGQAKDRGDITPDEYASVMRKIGPCRARLVARERARV